MNQIVTNPQESQYLIA